jgi:hypothetical protein
MCCRPPHAPIPIPRTSTPACPRAPAGAKLLFGGKALEGHSIPQVYGAVEPTAVFVPLAEALKPQHFEAVTTEVFGPFQVCE